MSLTGPADLAEVRPGDVFYWREQDPFGARFQRVTVTDVDPDTLNVRVDNEMEDSLLFDRRTAQVRWPDGLGRSYLEAATAQVEADYEVFLVERELIAAARATSQGPASVTGRSRGLRSREVGRLEAAIAAWKHARGEA